MQRILGATSTLAAAAVGAGIFVEFFTYDGKLLLMVWLQNISNRSLYIAVDAGTRAVIFDKMRGIQDIVVGEGTHFKIPFFQVGFTPVFLFTQWNFLIIRNLQVPIIMDVRDRPRSIHSVTGTKDLQMVCLVLNNIYFSLI